MTLTLHQATVPTIGRTLNNLAAILEKAAAHAEARKIDPAVLLGIRLFPDMLPLSTQIFIANDSAGAGVSRLIGADVRSFDGKDKSLPALITATRGTVAYLDSLKPDQFLGAEDRMVTWQTRSSTKTMPGTAYLFHHVLPNVFFHVTTAYDILRQAGVELGKRDFLGKS